MFSEPVTLAANATLRVQGAGGTAVDLVRGTAAGSTTYVASTTASTVGGTEYAAGRVVTVTVGTLGAGASINLPAAITAAAGFADASGNAVSGTLAGSGDVSIDTE